MKGKEEEKANWHNPIKKEGERRLSDYSTQIIGRIIPIFKRGGEGELYIGYYAGDDDDGNDDDDDEGMHGWITGWVLMY